MRASALCRLDFFSHMVTSCSAFFILQKNCLTQAPVPCNCFFSCKASRPPCNKCVFIIACELCHFRALLHSANSARALIASTLLIKSAIDRFRSSLIWSSASKLCLVNALASSASKLSRQLPDSSTALFRHVRLVQALPHCLMQAHSLVNIGSVAALATIVLRGCQIRCQKLHVGIHQPLPVV